MSTFILDLEPKFFNGKSLTELEALGYSENQIPYIQAELEKRNMSLAKEFMEAEDIAEPKAMAMPIPEDEFSLDRKAERKKR